MMKTIYDTSSKVYHGQWWHFTHLLSLVEPGLQGNIQKQALLYLCYREPRMFVNEGCLEMNLSKI